MKPGGRVKLQSPFHQGLALAEGLQLPAEGLPLPAEVTGPAEGLADSLVQGDSSIQPYPYSNGSGAGPTSVESILSHLTMRASVDLNLDKTRIISSPDWLGGGTWGDVFKGIYDGVDVAVKYIRWGGDMIELTTLQHELTILSCLKHPNILTIYGGSLTPDPEIFLVQELLAGSVADMMHGNKTTGRLARKLELMEALQIGADILKGMCYLHEHKVVHRDIKPANVLLTKDGLAKIGDFGLARFKLHTLLKTKTIVTGTAAYMAPEICDSGGVTCSVDIYSWAVTLWEMVLGKRPYTNSERDMSILWKVSQSMRPELPEASEQFPAAVRQLILKSWAQLPKDRPTAHEALVELQDIMADLCQKTGGTGTVT
mmetsp:Transcript_955/g.1490  ORF Transcript_955/g.1490 Transcript_955/m.1490 type:complete len:371 (-) Transcript_955:920-2032(-)|eukprot:CAMPEP_0119101678 /NCGR_PEP_ID=MMETSP1180-20130426/667_1 /TAXON_ID=3052 ORGANISM="Chlamydomonas cf sp, Strain CCMP681" /NCGR_SAMPLE_ID=MMETSP1180 /ASSEMBLY_ACC=CAM_ASM_000741 /LENGTH=370 /DNA_ID=CAMNT_0007085837 /DNA_START=66 /DNA_END=1178 /DNA_ORIENTATION=-